MSNGIGVSGNTAYPVGDGGFEAQFTIPQPASFFGQRGWWAVPQTWNCMTDSVGQIWVSPNAFPSGPTQAAPILAVTLDLPLAPLPPSTVLATTSVPHGFPAGDATYYVANPTPVTIAGASHSYFNGTVYITSVTDATHFTYSVAESGVDEVFDSGTVQGPDIPTQQPSPRYAAKISQDGTLVYQKRDPVDNRRFRS